ncbi:fructokinase [Paramicrobacterium humi]|uniref:Fructokinase n=1 Tax=Paramicrobacterium humi TaxID=640635 RepID=A0A1H4M4N5_9MICO|nr:PfkB family carbohydrate kinase [Microbacterium humi]SEB77966.1 fructokinase [Microbacterium humi]
MVDSVSPVVVIGDALIDELRDGNSYRETVGGAALNVAIGLTRLGVPATLIAMVGADAAGQQIREHLREHGVGLLATLSPRGSARAVSTRVGGEPLYEFNAAARERAICVGDAERRAIAAAPYVVVSSFPFDDNAQTDALASAVEDCKLVIDPNPRAGMLTDADEFAQRFEELAARCLLVKIGADDAALLYKISVGELRVRLANAGVHAVLATDGPSGATVQIGKRVIASSTVQLPGPVIDTMGAGDAVLASTVASLMQDEPVDEVSWSRAIERAMQIAAETVRHEGAMLRAPQFLA